MTYEFHSGTCSQASGRHLQKSKNRKMRVGVSTNTVEDDNEATFVNETKTRRVNRKRSGTPLQEKTDDERVSEYKKVMNEISERLLHLVNENNNTEKEIKDDVNRLARVTARMKEVGDGIIEIVESMAGPLTNPLARKMGVQVE